MREIKFRAIIKLPSRKPQSFIYTLETYDKYLWRDMDILAKDLQFTGLKDKNGKEVYEGDLIKYSSVPSPKEVIFRSGTFCYKLAEGQYHIFDEKSCEVIGNIYENPELLKP